MNQQKIGRFIANLRHEKGLTQEEFGNRIGVSSKTISRWENGNYMPDISLLEVISKELNITISELLKGERIEQDNLLNESNKDIINLLKNNKKDRKKYIKIFIVGLIILIIWIFLAIVQTIRINKLVEDDGIIFNENREHINKKGVEITLEEYEILNFSNLTKDEIENISREEIDLRVNEYYATLQAYRWYGSLGTVEPTGKKVKLYDTEVSVIKIDRRYLPFMPVPYESNTNEEKCVIGLSKYGVFVFSEYKNENCIIKEKECNMLKEDGTTSKINLEYYCK